MKLDNMKLKDPLLKWINSILIKTKNKQLVLPYIQIQIRVQQSSS